VALSSLPFYRVITRISLLAISMAHTSTAFEIFLLPPERAAEGQFSCVMRVPPELSGWIT
jgi:hypothetical protein